MRILLWDIDGTLINTGGAGMRALTHAIGASEAAVAALRRMRLDGMTDRRIARLLCAAELHRHEPHSPFESMLERVAESEIDRVLSLYLGALRESLRNTDRYVVLDGVRELLGSIGAQDALHGLGTGNVEEGARLKLEHGGLWNHFRFGGYGSDAEERAELLLAGRRKAEALLGRTCDPDEFVVIGDTPKDILAAHANGFACVAVATGSHSINELVGSGAEVVLHSLAQPGAREHILQVRRSS